MNDRDKVVEIQRENALTEYLLAGINGYRRRLPEVTDADVVIALSNVLVVQMTAAPDPELRSKQREVALVYLNATLDRIEPHLARIHASAGAGS